MDAQKPQLMSSTEDGILDEEFRRILWSIKQYIPFINSNYQLSLYRSWLEKLSLSNSEKVERNVYLFELARQIKNNTILPPFDKPPPTTNLKDLPRINHFRSSNTEVSNHNMRWPDVETSFQTPSYVENYCCPIVPQYGPGNERHFYVPPRPHQNNTSYSGYNHSLDNFYYNVSYDDEDDEDINELIQEKLKLVSQIKNKQSNTPPISSIGCPQNISVEKTNNEECRQTYGGSENVLAEENPSRDVSKNDIQLSPIEQQNPGVKDDSSWVDLTDASITSIANSLASGDCEKKNSAMTQERVKRFNEFKRMAEESTMSTDGAGIGLENHEKSNSDITVNNVIDESLKTVQYLNDAKLSLKDTNFISADWKKTMEALQLRLTETLQQNDELKAIINEMQNKMQDEVVRFKDQSQKIMSEQHNREIENLKQAQEDNIRQLEKSFQAKLDETERTYQQKIDKLKAGYDGKVKELKAERERAKKEKDREIARLTEIVQQQCTRMSNEIAALRHQIENSMSTNNEEKIVVLQKCISKMDKLFQKSEKEYQKQMEKMKLELDLKNKVMQVQLKTQRAELIARTSTEKQRHFDDVVNNLEVKYIKMLEYHEAQVMESRKHDEEKIERLLNLLEKNDIPYDSV